MSRLPVPNSDDDVWGVILNDFLSVEHNSDGTLKKAADIASAKAKADAAAVNTAVVHNTGDESIDGTKTFNASPLVPTPSAAGGASNKSYVDTAVAALGYTQGRPYFIATVAPYSADNTGATDAASAIQAAINAAQAAGGGIVFLPPGTYSIGATLILQNKVTLKGAGMWSSILLLANNVNGPVIKNYVSSNGTTDANAQFATIRDLHINGNKANNTGSTCYGIQYSANPLYSQTSGDLDFDTHNHVENVFIYNCKSNGFHGTGRSEIRLNNVTAYYCDGHGFYGSFDTFYNYCTSGHAGLNGFNMEDSSVRMIGCKAFYSGKITVDGTNGNGFSLRNGQGGLNLAGCEAQDNAGIGFALNNCNRGTLTSCIADSNSSGHVNNSVSAGTYPGFDLYNSNFNSMVGCVAYERRAYGGVSYQLNALRFGGTCTNNHIQLTHSATTYNGATVGAALTGSSPVNNTVTVNNQDGNQAIAYASSITPDPYAGGTVIVGTLTGNITVNNPSSAHTGCRLTFHFTQDGTGSRTVTWGGGYTVGGWTITSTASSTSWITFVYNGSSWVRIA